MDVIADRANPFAPIADGTGVAGIEYLQGYLDGIGPAVMVQCRQAAVRQRMDVHCGTNKRLTKIDS